MQGSACENMGHSEFEILHLYFSRFNTFSFLLSPEFHGFICPYNYVSFTEFKYHILMIHPAADSYLTGSMALLYD